LPPRLAKAVRSGRVLGLDGRAKPLSGVEGSGGARAVQRWRSKPLVEKEQGEYNIKRRRSNQCRQNNRAKGDRRKSCSGAKWWALRDNPNAPTERPFYTAHRKCYGPTGLADHSGHRLGKMVYTMCPCGPS
jgi:hypothetical protein